MIHNLVGGAECTSQRYPGWIDDSHLFYRPFGKKHVEACPEIHELMVTDTEVCDFPKIEYEVNLIQHAYFQ
jgi:hypothetical protein